MDHEEEIPFVLKGAENRQGNFNKIPKSCSDLASIGRMDNGLHLLKADDGIKVSFCDFSKPTNPEG